MQAQHPANAAQSYNRRTIYETRRSLPAVLQVNGVNALVIDTVQFYAELGAMQLGMPYIHVSAAMHFDFSGYTPLCFYGNDIDL